VLIGTIHHDQNYAVLPGFGPPIGSSSFSCTEIALGRVICGEPLSSEAMAKGKVDFFNDTGGYGFIETEDADEDVFFHMEDVGGPDLEEGTEIEFEIEDAPKGPRAKNVTRL
jgi:CspA family cold shock protein